MPKKHKCCKCNNTAVWEYSPGITNTIFYCDEHVPRGCGCNIYNLEMYDPLVYNEVSGNILWWNKHTLEDCLNNGIDIEKCATRSKENDSFYFEELDENGKREPCCEYCYSSDGFEFYGNIYYVKLIDIKKCFGETLRKKMFGHCSMGEEIYAYIKSINVENVPYNSLLPNLKRICYRYITEDMDERSIANEEFYRSLRGRLYNCRFLID